MSIEKKTRMIVDSAVLAFCDAINLEDLDKEKSLHLGKRSAISLAISSLKTLDVISRSILAKELNAARSAIECAYLKRKEVLIATVVEHTIASGSLDVSLPGRGRSVKGLHPLSLSLIRIQACFSSLGFSVAEGPELETAYYNFTSLNMPADHPARSMHDTFYIDGHPDVQLRTHTSPIQTRYMQRHAATHLDAGEMPEIRIIAPGNAYRVDSDATHSPMFHQLEGLWVSESASLSNLKWVVQEFLKAFFESTLLEARFRPSFFPFTEPSAEIDLSFSDGPSEGRWLEVGGCGMVHPSVLEFCGIDAQRYCGFAFGMGVDRLTMLRYGIEDLRTFYENDLRFLRQFN